MQIGNIKLHYKASLAPMAGVADRAFREVCAQFGVTYFTSEMISVNGLIFDNEKTKTLIAHSEIEKPFAVQLFGSNPDQFAEAALKISQYKPDIIDINMGCPMPKIVNNGAGAALMYTPELCGKIVKKLTSEIKIPITVKIRSGINKNSKNGILIAKICEYNGASAITVHGRTKSQMYSGMASLEVIKEIKNAVKIPVIGNGDVNSIESFKKMMECCDMVAIGRGSLGNPWIFAQINEFLSKKNFNIPNLNQKCEIMKLHVDKLCKYNGEINGIKKARKHLMWYVKGVHGASKLKSEICTLKTKHDFLNFIKLYKKTAENLFWLMNSDFGTNCNS